MGAYDVTVEDGKAIFTKKPYVTKAQRAAAKGIDGKTGDNLDELAKATEAVPSPPTPLGPTDPKPARGGSAPQADPQT